MPKGLPLKVKLHLEKAKESALLAIELYNKPATVFKTRAFVVMMNIAWTSLFHAIAFQKRINPYCKISARRYATINGEIKYWGIEECVNWYFKVGEENPIKANILFLTKIRHKIEHSFYPELDDETFPECQQSILNFSKILRETFGVKHSIKETLKFSLQFISDTTGISKAVKNEKQYINIKNFIDKYRSSLSDAVKSSTDYAFRAVLIKVTNYDAKETIPIKFVNAESLSDEAKAKLGDVVGCIIKDRSPEYELKPTDVYQRVQKGLKEKGITWCNAFTMDTHTRAWAFYKAREPKPSQKANPLYCRYDKPHNDFVYHPKWVEFLVGEMSNKEKFEEVSGKVID